jgi:hypothetical protein
MGTRRSPRQAVVSTREYSITRVLTVNVETGETCRVPNMRFTLRDIQDMIKHHEASGTVDLTCQTCSESVADCIELAPLLTGVPASWSWTSKVDQGF